MKLTTEQENDLIKKYDYLIWRIAERYCHNGNLQELHSLGMIGALEGIRYYDPSKNVPLEKTVALYIKRAITDHYKKEHTQKRRMITYTDKYDTTILEETTPDVIDETYNLKLDMLLTAAQMFDEKDYDVIVLTQKEWLEKYGYKPTSSESYQIRRRRIINLLKKEFNDEKEY